MPIRDRIALALAGTAAAVLPTTAWLAASSDSRRIDLLVLGAALLLQLGLLFTWAVIRRLPRLVVAGYGLATIALGLGFTIAAPQPEAGEVAGPWAFTGMLIAGLLTMIAAVVHSREPDRI